MIRRSSERHHLANITSRFGLRLTRARALRSLYKQRAAFHIYTEQGEWLVKPFKRRLLEKTSSLGQIKRMSAHIHRLTEAEYPHFPPFLQTKSGKQWTKCGKRYYYVTAWMKGQPLQQVPEDYYKLGQVLARLHAIPLNKAAINIDDRTSQQQQFLKLQDLQFRRRLPKLRKRKTKIGRWMRRHGSQCIQLADEAWEVLQQAEVKQWIKKERPSLIHGDITIPNIMKLEENMVLIDWDGIRIGSAYDEIAKALMNTANFNEELIRAFMEGYEAVKPLNPSERQLVGALYRLPREAWFAARHASGRRGREVFHLLSQSWNHRLEAVRRHFPINNDAPSPQA